MGDVRFVRFYNRVRDSPDPARELRKLPDEEVIGALAAARGLEDPLLANVLATEAMNRARRARAIASHIGEGVFIMDEAARFTFANPKAYEILQWKEETLIGEDAEATLRPSLDDGTPFDLVMAVHDAADRGQSAIERDDLSFERSDGTVIPVFLTASTLRFNGLREGCIVTFRDATERRASLDALTESENRYRVLAESIVDMVSTATPDGILSYVSPASRQTLGYEPAELIGRSWQEIIHPDDIAVLEHLGDAILSGAPWTATYRALDKQGRRVWVETHARALLDADTGEPRELVAVSRDVTARHAETPAEACWDEQGGDILDNLPDLVLCATPHGLITFASPASRDLLGKKPHEVIGARLWDLFDPREADAIRERCRALPVGANDAFRGRLARRLAASSVSVRMRASVIGQETTLIAVVRPRTRPSAGRLVRAKLPRSTQAN